MAALPRVPPGSVSVITIGEINAAAALADKDSVFYTYRQLIGLRKTLPVLTCGDYQDLLPDHPTLWCYRRRWQGPDLDGGSESQCRNPSVGK